MINGAFVDYQFKPHKRSRGAHEEDGCGAGRGFTINVPLSPGTGDKGYLNAVNKVVAPVCRQFDPDLMLVSAGQDAAVYDPFGRNMLSYQGFEEMTAIVKELANALCSGRLLMVQEGGYNIIYRAFSVLAILEVLCGEKTGIAKLWENEVLYEAESFEKDIDQIVRHHRSFWRL